MTALINVADCRDTKTGKTFRQLNTEKQHAIPLKTLVEIMAEPDALDIGDHAGVRAYVAMHTRDCDGEPLYSLSYSRDFIEDNQSLLNDKKYKILANCKLLSGFPEYCLRIVDLTKRDWILTPSVGNYVVADHPITVANPYKVFRVAHIRSCYGKISVRGNHTMWFDSKMLRPATSEEMANCDKTVHPSEQ